MVLAERRRRSCLRVWTQGGKPVLLTTVYFCYYVIKQARRDWLAANLVLDWQDACFPSNTTYASPNMAAPYGPLVSEQEVTCEKGKKGSSGVGVGVKGSDEYRNCGLKHACPNWHVTLHRCEQIIRRAVCSSSIHTKLCFTIWNFRSYNNPGVLDYCTK